MLDTENEENSDTSVLTEFDRKTWSEGFWRQGSEGQSGEGQQQGQDATGCHPNCSWGAETFGEGDGHRVPGEERTLGCVCGCGGDCHMSFLWSSGNARSSCCKPLDVRELQSMFTCVYTT